MAHHKSPLAVDPRSSFLPMFFGAILQATECDIGQLCYIATGLAQKDASYLPFSCDGYTIPLNSDTPHAVPSMVLLLIEDST